MQPMSVSLSAGPTTRTLIRTLAVVALAAIFTGCGLSMKQRMAMRQFGSATVDLAETASKSFVGTRDDVVRLRTGMYELGSTSIDMNDEASDLDGPLSPDELEIRLRAVDAMKHFGELLQRLVGDQDTAAIQRSADALVSNLGQMKGVHFSDEKSAALKSVVNKIAGLFVANLKKKAARVAILETREPIEDIVSLLSKDFDAKGLYWVTTLSETSKAIGGTLKKEIELLAPDEKRKFPATKARPLSQADIALMFQRFELLDLDAKESVKRVETESRGIGSSIVAFREAHKEAVYVIQTPEIVTLGQIEAFFDEVQETRRQVDVIRRK